MKIRKALRCDLESIMKVYRVAQDYMIGYGNADQWGRSYPSEADVASDIERGACRVIYDETGIHAVFAVCEGEDQYYKRIDGKWQSEEEYIAIHRVASDGTFRGVVTCAVEYCRPLCKNIRADTHEKNIPMQRQLEKNGFVKCGTVYVRDGTPRIAYQRKEGLEK